MASVRDLILNVVEKKEGNALTAAANDLEKLGRGVDATGGAMHDMENDAKKLNAEIEKSSARIKDLHKQFAATGDAGLFGDIRKEESRLRNLQKTLKSITADAAVVSNVFSKQFGSQFGSAFGGLTSPGALAGIAVGLTALAVPLGAALAGAVVGTVGTGGIVGGVLAASRDQKVKSAFQSLAAQAKAEFFGAGGSFVDPVLKSVGILATELHRVNLAGIFGAAAPDLEIIAKGIADLVDKSLPGLNDLLARSKPFAEAAAHGFGEIGDALTTFLDATSQSHGAVEGLEALFAGIAGTIKLLGVVLLGAAGAFHFFNNTAAGAVGVLDKTLDIVHLHSSGVHDLGKSLRKLAGDTSDTATVGTHFGDVLSANNGAVISTTQALGSYSESLTDAAHHAQALADEITAANKAIDDYVSIATDAWGATINLAKGYSDLKDAINEGAIGWDLNTRTGQKNQQMIEDQITAAQRARDTQIALGDGTEESSNKAIVAYDAELKKILVYAQALGATKAQLDAIAKTYYANVIVTLSEKNQLHKATAIDQALANLGFYADGGTVPGPIGAAQLAVVHGGERVLTPPQAAAMSAPSAGDGATMAVIFGGNVDSAYATGFMKLIRSGDITISSKAVV